MVATNHYLQQLETAFSTQMYIHFSSFIHYSFQCLLYALTLSLVHLLLYLIKHQRFFGYNVRGLLSLKKQPTFRDATTGFPAK